MTQMTNKDLLAVLKRSLEEANSDGETVVDKDIINNLWEIFAPNASGNEDDSQNSSVVKSQRFHELINKYHDKNK
tara:strand:- start:323 stop:547 length:225 start_codon:yes stop_codon:yes gene_type:complete